jgi:hypothetical protein
MTQEPVALPCCGYADASAIKWNPYNQVVHCHNCGQIYTIPLQPEQEPVGEVVNATDKAFECKFIKILPIGTKLYTTSPQRTWVGLTRDEQSFVYSSLHDSTSRIDSFWVDFANAIEAKLKEKNSA